MTQLTLTNSTLIAPATHYTYFVAYYGKDFQKQTAVLYVKHSVDLTVQRLDAQIRQQIDEILGQETAACYHILAMATPEAVLA